MSTLIVDGEQNDPGEDIKMDSDSYSLEKVEPVSNGPAPPPDGGLTAWLQVIVMFFGTWNSWGVVNAFGVYQEYYQSTLLRDTSAGTISWIGTLQGALIYFGAIVIGPLYDLGLVKYMLLTATILQAFAFMMLSLSTRYYQILLAQGICSGIAASLAFVCGVSSVSTWWNKRRPMAAGIGALGAAFGGVIYSITARETLKRVGFAWSARIIGFIMLATEFVAFLCCKHRLPPRKTGSFVDLKAFTEIPITSLSWSVLLVNAGAYVFYFYAQTYGSTQLKNADPNVMVYISAILNAGSVPGRLIPNYLAQWVGPITVFTICTIATTVLMWFWLLAKNEAGLIVIAVLIGFFTGPVVSLPAPSVATLTPDLSKFGTRLAYTFIHGGVGFLIGPPLGGILIRNYAWKYGIYYGSALCVLACITSVLCRQITKSKKPGPA